MAAREVLSESEMDDFVHALECFPPPAKLVEEIDRIRDIASLVEQFFESISSNQVQDIYDKLPVEARKPFRELSEMCNVKVIR